MPETHYSPCFLDRSSFSASGAANVSLAFSFHIVQPIFNRLADGIAASSMFFTSTLSPWFFMYPLLSRRGVLPASPASSAASPMLFHGIRHGLTAGHPYCLQVLVGRSAPQTETGHAIRPLRTTFFIEIPPWVMITISLVRESVCNSSIALSLHSIVRYVESGAASVYYRRPCSDCFPESFTRIESPA